MSHSHSSLKGLEGDYVAGKLDSFPGLVLGVLSLELLGLDQEKLFLSLVLGDPAVNVNLRLIDHCGMVSNTAE